MAELLVRYNDKTNASSEELDAMCSKKFDVVVIVPNGWVWSSEELSNPDWRILALPKISEEFLAPLVDSGDEAAGSGFLSTRRKRRLNMIKQAVPQVVRDWWNDTSRSEPIYTINATFATIQDYVEEKSRLVRLG